MNKLIGKRFKSLKDLKDEISLLTGRRCVNCIESESERIEECDFMLDVEFENDDDVYTIFYLKDNANNYYITEV